MIFCKACYLFVYKLRSKSGFLAGQVYSYPLALKAHMGKNTQNLLISINIFLPYYGMRSIVNV